MQNITNDGHREVGKVFFIVPDGVHVQQALRRMGVPAIACIDDMNMWCNVLGNQVRRTGFTVPNHKNIGGHRT